MISLDWWVGCILLIAMNISSISLIICYYPVIKEARLATSVPYLSMLLSPMSCYHTKWIWPPGCKLFLCPLGYGDKRKNYASMDNWELPTSKSLFFDNNSDISFYDNRPHKALRHLNDKGNNLLIYWTIPKAWSLAKRQILNRSDNNHVKLLSE